MTLNIASHQAAAYQVSTPVYEGPLDLLLHLIERAELDITRLALAQVTDQYLEHLRQIQEQSPEEVSAFLVIAARLIQIKSEALLPRPPVRQPDEEDPGAALAQQLLAYKRFRQIADLLSRREEQHMRSYLRLAPPPKIEGTVDLSGLGLPDLIAAAQSIFFANEAKTSLNRVVTPPKVTIREKIAVIARMIRRKGSFNFRSVLTRRHSRLDVVVTFLALLELVKRRLVNAKQDALFGEIEVEATPDWQDDTDFELEFGE